MNVIEKEKAKFVISERKEDTHIVSLMVIILLFYFWLLTFFMFTIIQTFYSLFSSFIIILSSLLSYFIYLHISSYHSFNFSFIFSRTTTQSWKIWSSKLSRSLEYMAMRKPCCRFNGTGGLRMWAKEELGHGHVPAYEKATKVAYNRLCLFMHLS